MTRGDDLDTLSAPGTTGEVILSHDPQIGRDVAIKRMRAELAASE